MKKLRTAKESKKTPLKRYVVYLNETDFVIFPTSMDYEEVAGDRPVYSAGLVSISSGRPDKYGQCKIMVSCHGGSESLGVESDPEFDSLLIGEFFNGVAR